MGKTYSTYRHKSNTEMIVMFLNDGFPPYLHIYYFLFPDLALQIYFISDGLDLQLSLSKTLLRLYEWKKKVNMNFFKKRKKKGKVINYIT